MFINIMSLFYRLLKLKVLEIRENHLKTLPKSFSMLTALERLDIGHNEFTELVSYRYDIF